MPDDTGRVLVETADGISTVWLNQPERRNPITRELVDALDEALEAAIADPAVRVVVLTGAGDAFSVGADLTGSSESAPPAPSPPSTGEYRRQTLAVARLVELLTNPAIVSVAAINGACAGAGLALALAADLRYAASTARFNTGFLAFGYPGEMGAIWSATQFVGTARARELFLLPGKTDARALADIGLLTGVHEPAELMSEVDMVARELAGRAPLALAAMKANLNDAVTASLPEYLLVEAERMARCATSEDAAEARRAHRENRPPGYVGR